MLTLWVGLVVICLIGLIKYVNDLIKYWKNQNVPYIPLGLPVTTKWLGELFKDYYDWGKKNGYSHIGLFTLNVPTYMPIDPSIIKSILTTDYNYFSDRGWYYNEKDDPIGAHLFVLKQNKWKQLRSKLTPTFTSGKIKTMFPNVVQIACNLKDAIGELAHSKKPVDIKYYSENYTIDVIGNCAFGLDCNSFKNPNSEFRKYGHKVVSDSRNLVLKSFLYNRYSTLADFFRLRTMDKNSADFYLNVTRDTINYRETNNVTRNDFLQLMMNLKNDSTNGHGDNGLTIEEIAAEAFLFLVAGYETSSSTVTFSLYELALNLKLQEKVRAEINGVVKKYCGELTYEGIMEMKYMDRVINETLRKHPPVSSLSRNCVADYQVPNTDLIIKKQTLVIIPTYGLHYDPVYYPDPEKFDPERFSDENKSTIKPFTYLPFGDGPKICIGLRFAVMQVKVAIATLLQNYAFSLNEKTTTPLIMDPKYFVVASKNTIWLNVSKLEETPNCN